MNAGAGPPPAAIELADLRDTGLSAEIERFVADMGGTLFHRPLWLRAVERGTGQSAHGLLARRRGQLTGWLPLTAVHSPLFGRALVSSGFGMKGGPLAERDQDSIALCRAAEELAQRLSASTIDLRGGVAPHDWRSVNTTHAYFEKELAADDTAQLLSIPRRARAEVRKSLLNDLQVSIGNGPDDRAAHYACYAEGVRNHGTPVFPRSLFDAVLDTLGQDADILTVRHQGVPLTSLLTVYHGGAAMPYWGASAGGARAMRGSERAYFELMLHARRRGCVRFDFGRSKTGSGPFHFKKNWGFDPQPLTYSSWNAPGVTGRNIDPTDAGYSGKIALWKRLPLPVANFLGPFIARGLG